MLAHKKSCAKCGKSTGSLHGCSQCRRVLYCGRECQRSDWPKHKQTCKLNASAVVFKSMADHQESPENTVDQAVIQGINYIFDELTGSDKQDAITAMIQKTKDERRTKKSSQDLLGVAQNYMTMCLIYLKMKYNTDAKDQIDKCACYVKRIEELMVNDPVALNDPVLQRLKVSLEWNRMVIDTDLMKVDNESKKQDVQLMVMGPERRESTYALVEKLLQQQKNCMQLKDFNQCFLIQLDCITLSQEIDNEESGNVDKTRELIRNTMAHSQSMILEHGAKIDKQIVDSFQDLYAVFAFKYSNGAAMGRF